jgi:hypothetical protein
MPSSCDQFWQRRDELAGPDIGIDDLLPKQVVRGAAQRRGRVLMRRPLPLPGAPFAQQNVAVLRVRRCAGSGKQARW